MTKPQPEALRLAAIANSDGHITNIERHQIDCELRRLHAENERLSELCDKWNSECDEFREDNKRLAALVASLRYTLWVLAEHNALHFGESHSTVIQARQALAALVEAQQPAPSAASATQLHSKEYLASKYSAAALATPQADPPQPVVGDEQKALKALHYYMTECSGHEPSISVFHRMVEEALAPQPAPTPQAAPSAAATNTKTHDLLSTTVGLLMGYREGAARQPYKPGSMIAKIVDEVVDHLKDWPHSEPTPTPQADSQPLGEYLGNGMHKGQTIEDAAEDWASWCERQDIDGLHQFLRVVAARAPVDSNGFEGWYSRYNPAHKSDKQRAKDAYVAGGADSALEDAEPAPDMSVMQLAESVGLIGPASRVGDLHAAIQRFHDLICVNATIKAAVMAADAINGVRKAIDIERADREKGGAA